MTRAQVRTQSNGGATGPIGQVKLAISAMTCGSCAARMEKK